MTKKTTNLDRCDRAGIGWHCEAPPLPTMTICLYHLLDSIRSNTTLLRYGISALKAMTGDEIASQIAWYNYQITQEVRYPRYQEAMNHLGRVAELLHIDTDKSPELLALVKQLDTEWLEPVRDMKPKGE